MNPILAGIDSVITTVSGVLYMPWVPLLLLSAGLVFTFRSRFIQLRLLRENIVIHEGVIATLKRFKDDVKEVAQGYECGITIEKYGDVKVGDVIEAFIMEQIEV